MVHRGAFLLKAVGILLLTSTIQLSNASGYFELQINSIQNIAGQLSSGNCCDGVKDYDGSCTQDACDTYFRVCLKEYQVKPSASGTCTFGRYTSPVLGGNSFSLSNNGNNAGRLRLSFVSWTSGYTLILEAWDRDNSSRTDGLIDSYSVSGMIHPGNTWQNFQYNGPTAVIDYKIRVLCDEHYYGSNCSRLCRPKDDFVGHFTCDQNGNKVCREGWMGADCKTPVCRVGCNTAHGHCSVPGQCRCQYGWQGPLCDQCIPYPGCVHGSCHSPWECLCDTNWGGLLCDKDLNFCGRHQPCLNGGTCHNEDPDEYRCECLEGFSGRSCEIAEQPCVSNPCQNGGQCTEVSNGFRCTCALGWTGDTCDIDIDDCKEPNPCAHGGRCVDELNGYHCQCPPGWLGSTCQIDDNECEDSPCEHAYACRNLIGDYVCDCQPGWTGKNCHINIPDCTGQCQNGATCVDLVNGYHCECALGFEGRRCQRNINECLSNPCRNGGQCVDGDNSYTCRCPLGFVGRNCEIDVDFCNPNPCQNDAQCYNLETDYFCQCRDGFEGKNCTHLKDHCRTGPCEVIDSCTVAVSSNTSSDGVMIISSNVCGDHGNCISQSDGDFTCACNRGYTGTFCQENINDCAVNRCLNGATCVDGINSFQCVCAEGWEGILCNQNKNECSPNPCRNNGTCVDHVADFSCHCKRPWKGRTCNNLHSHCDDMTCAHGGTCIDLGDTFTCLCSPGWEGFTCHIAKNHSCASNPCQNGATCINSGDSYTCMCKEGFEGPQCQDNVNDCNPHPCYNGGSCVDGVNWYRCECAEGFVGPDCRININDCASHPCAYGSTCLDGINDYTCKCPAGRTGRHCELVLGDLQRQPCWGSGGLFAHGTKWEDECNTCSCRNGEVVCSQIWCGPEVCFAGDGNTMDSMECPPGQYCMVPTEDSCFTPPCGRWGHCRTPGLDLPSGPVSRTTTCLPNTTELDNNCAKITLMFDKTRMSTGVCVEDICNTLRHLPVLDEHAWDKSLLLLCDTVEDINNSIAVAVSTEDTTGGRDNVVREVVNAIADYISKKQSNSSILAAIVEVKVETTIINYKDTLMVPLICAVVGSIVLISLVVVLIWCLGRRRKRRPPNPDHRINLENKTNNKQEDVNVQRYRNPIYQPIDKGTHSRNSLDSVDNQHREKVTHKNQRVLYKRDSYRDRGKHNLDKRKNIKDINTRSSQSVASIELIV
ncbi:protein jagged-1-like isoform X1 [Branchiostoma floridae x Branchiostoma japonicum]